MTQLRRLVVCFRQLVVLLAMGCSLTGVNKAWAEAEILEPSDIPIAPATPTSATDTLSSDSAGQKVVASDSSQAAQTVETAQDSATGPETSGITIEVDKTLGRNADKNLGLALLGAAILPGTGEWYLRSGEKGRGFIIAEVGFWAALFMGLSAQDAYLQSARNQASEYAGIDASSKGDGFLNTMAEFRSYREKEHRNDSYELAQILSGKRNGDYAIPATPENDWDFGSSNTPQNTRNWKSFQSTLRHYRASKVAVTFAIGGLAMNRLIAMAHTLHLYRRTAVQGLSENSNKSSFENRFTVLPEIGPSYAGGRLTLTF